MADSLDSTRSVDELFVDAGYALFFEAMLNEPLLDLELFRAISSEPEGLHSAERTTT